VNLFGGKKKKKKVSDDGMVEIVGDMGGVGKTHVDIPPPPKCKFPECDKDASWTLIRIGESEFWHFCTRHLISNLTNIVRVLIARYGK
jgi:hypothetical protein